MTIRKTQLIGLKYPDIEEHIDCTIINKYSVVEGMFNEIVCPLFRYKTLDGQIIEEYVQAELWSYGPIIFLSVRVSDKNKLPDDALQEKLEQIFDWTDEEINEYL